MKSINCNSFNWNLINSYGNSQFVNYLGILQVVLCWANSDLFMAWSGTPSITVNSYNTRYVPLSVTPPLTPPPSSLPYVEQPANFYLDAFFQPDDAGDSNSSGANPLNEDLPNSSGPNPLDFDEDLPNITNRRGEYSEDELDDLLNLQIYDDL